MKMSDTKLICASCGAEANASCSCGVDYKPKSVRAAEAIKLDPGRSDRAIAADIGVGSNTVRRARKSVAPRGAPETVTGRDGKNYKAKPRRPSLREERAREERAKDFVAKTFDAMVLELIGMTRGGYGRFAKTVVPKEELLFLSNCLKDLAGEMEALTSAVA
jgi:hypothetical protein